MLGKQITAGQLTNTEGMWWLRVGEPQEEGYDVDSSKFPLSNLPKVIEPVGFGWRQKSAVDGDAFNNVEPAQKQTRTLPNSK